MKHFNNLKLVSSFREISNTLELMSKAVRFFALGLVVVQALLIIKDTKEKD